jgi:hypothetical protein
LAVVAGPGKANFLSEIPMVEGTGYRGALTRVESRICRALRGGSATMGEIHERIKTSRLHKVSDTAGMVKKMDRAGILKHYWCAKGYVRYFKRRS